MVLCSGIAGVDKNRAAENKVGAVEVKPDTKEDEEGDCSEPRTENENRLGSAGLYQAEARSTFTGDSGSWKSQSTMADRDNGGEGGTQIRLPGCRVEGERGKKRVCV